MGTDRVEKILAAYENFFSLVVAFLKETPDDLFDSVVTHLLVRIHEVLWERLPNAEGSGSRAGTISDG